MKVLIDTHTFLWWCMDDEQLSSHAREIIADGRNEIYLSAASAWRHKKPFRAWARSWLAGWST